MIISIKSRILENILYIVTVPKYLQFLTQISAHTMYRVFTGNCGKVTYYTFGSIANKFVKFVKFVYLDYYVWTYITTNFQ